MCDCLSCCNILLLTKHVQCLCFILSNMSYTFVYCDTKQGASVLCMMYVK